MALHFLPHEETGIGSLANILGGLSGTGIGMLGGYAMNQYGLPEKIKKFEAFGATPEQAKALANSSDAQQTAWLKEAMKEQARQKQAAVFSNLVSGGQQLPVQQPEQMAPMAPQGGMNALNALQQEQPVTQPVKQEAKDVTKVLGGRSVEDLQEYRDRVLRSGGDPKLIQDAVQILDRQIMEKAKLESGRRKEALEERKFSASEQREVNKETKPFYDSVKTKAKAAEDNDIRLDRMEELVKGKKLTGPGFFSVMSKFGLPLDPESSEFEKLSNDFLKNAKSIFGSRITDRDIIYYLKTVPTLGMSDAGKLRVINNLKIMNEGSKAENKAMKDIIKENGGRRPYNLEELVEERTKSIKDKLAKEFKEGSRNAEIAEETGIERAERLLTGPAATVGAAGIGALAGSLLGPVGTALGGLGGGALSHVLGLLNKHE